MKVDEELKEIAKGIANAAVLAKLQEMPLVVDYLDRAFDELVRTAGEREARVDEGRRPQPEKREELF